jgi:retron-type reverse transcriptase
VNVGPELGYALYEAERRVREIQAKLHRWAGDDPHRRFDDLYNLVYDPAFLMVAWARVRGNKGARSAGVDGQTAYSIEAGQGVEAFLDRLWASLKDRSFRPLPVRERMIPKPGGKKRRLGIAAVTDRVVQASLKLVLEPIFEADFLPCSYGFRPNRRTHDAVAEIRRRPLLGNGHGGCWRPLGETHRWKHRQGAPSRPHGATCGRATHRFDDALREGHARDPRVGCLTRAA